jgi:hypothetical protein
MRLFAPTKTRKCWLCIDDMYQGHGPSAEWAILNMEYWGDRHLKGMAEEEDIPKKAKEGIKK